MKYIKSFESFNYTPTEVPTFGWHQTSLSNALLILQHGFKTGKDLNKGEAVGGIYFAPTNRGMDNVVYRRGDIKDKTVFLKVSLSGLNLLDTKDLQTDPNLLSFQQPAYMMKQSIEIDGVFPEGYDGIIIRGYKGGVYEIILKPEVANSKMIKSIFNNKNQEIN